MEYSSFLASRKNACKRLIKLLNEKFDYVSILGCHVTGKAVAVDLRSTGITDSTSECGFVVKVYNLNHYSEYACNDICDDNLDTIVAEVVNKTTLDAALANNSVKTKIIEEEECQKVFIRKKEGKELSLEEIVDKVTKIKNSIKACSPLVINARVMHQTFGVSKCFYSNKKDLEQFYSWTLGVAMAFVRKDNVVKYAMDTTDCNSDEKVFDNLEEISTKVVDLAIELLDSKPIEPGVYDVITDPSITGLIAHEAFGHGVEMDMFVKNRALAKDYINKYVASPLVNMHDGAQAAQSIASYFFDDDGVLASDTLIIKDGILQTGISDALSALQLGTKPTGNGRREAFSHKSYTRMTNTFFSPGKDKLADMIKSVKHGYMLFQTSNGMEDPKNWGIQCVAQYGREIVDGKFSGKIVSPVVMSGYVPDLLKSISMVSDEFHLSGFGSCGKGHKEWVRVSDGGPHLKARVKLG